MPTAAELVFRIQAQGTAELDKVAAATKSIGEGTRLAGAQLKTFDSTLQSLVSSGKTFRQSLDEMARSSGVLSQSIRSTAADLLTQIKAAEGDTEAIRKLTGAHRDLIGANIATGAALRDLNGAMNTRAIENFTSKVLGLGPIMQAAFPLVGAFAFGEMLVQLWEKIDPLARAEKDLAQTTKQLDSEFAQLESRLEQLQIQEITEKFGKLAGLQVKSFYEKSDAENDIARFNALGKEIDQLKAKLVDTSKGSWFDLIPLVGYELEKRSNAATQLRIQAKLDEQDAITARVNGRNREHAAEQERQNRDSAGKSHEQNRATDEYVKSKVNATLDPIQRAFADFADFVQRFKDAAASDPNARPLSAANRRRAYDATLTNAGQLVMNEYWRNRSSVIKREARPAEIDQLLLSGGEAPLPDLSDRYGRPEDRMDGKLAASWLKTLHEDLQTMVRLSDIQNRVDTSGVQRGLEVNLRSTALNPNLRGTTSGAAADYAARVNAALRVFEIDKRGLDLIEDKDQRDRKFADARLRREESIYQAQAQYEEQLAALREHDLEKYRGEAGKIFDAITDRVRGMSSSIGLLFRGAAVSLGRTVFENATTPVLQAAGHAIGGAIPGQQPGSILGTLLHGTVFDSANANSFQAQTADHTGKAVQWLSQIHSDLTGQRAVDPSAATLPAGMSAAGGSLGASGVALSGTLASALGKGSAFGGAFGNFGAGASSVLSGNALSILLGTNTSGPTTLSAQLGAAVGLAGALGAGTYGIMSGIGQGGPRGDLTAAGSAAGLAGVAVKNISKLLGATGSALSAVPVVGTILAAALPLIGSLFGNSKQLRQNQITNELAQNQYLAPTALNVTQGMNGTYEDFDARGNIRTSSLSAVPTVLEPYITSRRLYYGDPRTYYNAPGNVTSPYGGSAPGTGGAPVGNGPQTVIIQAMDAQSFHDFAARNHEAIGGALARNLQAHDGTAAHMIRHVTG